MAVLIERYSVIKDSNEKEDIKESKKILTEFFSYADKIVVGIIYSPGYNFWRYAEIDDLVQEARVAILLSLNKTQWDPARGSIFNFFSTVVSKNLMNYTNKVTKNSKRYSYKKINDACSNIVYNHDFEKNFIMNEVFDLLQEFLSGKKTAEELLELLKKYYDINFGEKFIKKDFIEYCGAYGYSPATVNTFFLLLKRIKYQKNYKYNQILDILNEVIK